MRKYVLALVFTAICPLLMAQQSPEPANTKAAPQETSGPTPTATPQPNTLVDGTPVKLRLSQTISSADAKVGQEIPFEVVEEIKVEDFVVLPKGATAIATVTAANPKKSMGREGKLDIAISYARLTDQEKVALRASKEGHGGGHVGAMTGAMVATTIVFFPAAPLFLFMKGKDITIPQGTEITAFIEGDMHLDMAKFGATPAVPIAAPIAAPVQASLIIDSTPRGADIEVDGNFVGNTPSTVNVSTGSHDVAVKEKGYTNWTRKLNVTGGSVHLNANLDAVPAAQ